jgi:hypothetical protein
MSLFADITIYTQRATKPKRQQRLFAGLQQPMECRMSETNGLKTKCGECSSKSFAVLDEKVIEKHLTGKITAAVYPMFPDDTCHFIVMGFDSPITVKANTSRC